MAPSLRNPMIRPFFAAMLLSAHSLWALTGGPSQPEYTGFTPSTKTGSVDLYSGDFSYSIPLLTVPGPSFNYPVTLGYRGGITTDQASSWVGLGWSLNAGSINRALNKYPDDYNDGRAVNILEGTKTVRAMDVGVSYMGIGLTVGQRSDHGWHGGLDISMAGYDIGGLKYDQVDGFGMREMTSLTDQFIGKLSGAYGSAANGQLNDLLGTQEIGLSVNPSAHGMNVSVAGVGFGSSSISSGAFNNKTFGISIPVLTTGITIDFSTARSWLYKKEDERLYGYLNLQDFPREKSGENFETKNFKMEYNFSPDDPQATKNGNSVESWIYDRFFGHKAFMASTPDGYQASGEGVSLSFRPYRQEIGEYFGAERLEAELDIGYGFINNTWFAYIPFLERRIEEQKDLYNSSLGLGAVRFVKQNPAAVTDEQVADYAKNQYGSPVTLFREIGTSGGTFMGENWRSRKTDAAAPRCGDWQCEFNYRRRTNGIVTSNGDDYENPEFKKMAGNMHYPDRISGGSGVFPIYKKDYSATGTDGDLALCPSVNTQIPQCDPAVPKGALIGFTVVRPDGMIYEYHRPVFTWSQITTSVTRPATTKQSKYDFDFGDYLSTSTLNRAYATSWLLTAIKAPDYVDISPAGPDNNDIGSWTSFAYGKRIRNFQWRTPYEGLNPMGVGKDQSVTGNSKEMKFESYGQASWGTKEIYYLTSISTPSHVANFLSSPKLNNDGKEASIQDGARIVSVSPLKLAVQSVIPNVEEKVSLTWWTGLMATAPATGCLVGKGIGTKVTADRIVKVVDLPTTGTAAQNGNFGNPVLTLDAVLTGPCPNSVHVTRNGRNGSGDILSQLDDIELRLKATNELVTKVHFDFDAGNVTTQLAPGVPDVAVNLGGAGKLTLRAVKIGDGQIQMPPYQFKYFMEGNEAPYGKYAWDRWGYFKRDGGWVNTTFQKGHVTDWSYYLNLLKSTSTTDNKKKAFEAALHLELDNGDFDALKASPSVAAIREGYYRAMVKALNRMRTDPNFYYTHRGEFTWGGIAATWRTFAGTEGVISAASPYDLAKPIANMNAYEKNVLAGLAAAMMADKYFLNGAAKTINRELSTLKYDHETNPEDVKAWSLKQVKLPSGGKIDVEYESDDFVYVGRRRIMDLADVDQFKTNGNLDYFKNISQEKSLSGASNLLNFDEAMMGEAFWTDPSKTKLRVSSLFRVYKFDKEKGKWGPTPLFEKMNKTGFPLTLLGWYNGIQVNSNIISGSDCGYVKLAENGNTGATGGLGFLSPFVLGSKSLVGKIEMFDSHDATWFEENQCQRFYVDFDLSAIKMANLEAANKTSVTNPCNTLNDPSGFLKTLKYLTLGWARPRDQADQTDWPLFIPLTQAAQYDGDYAMYSKFVNLDNRSVPTTPRSAKNLYPKATEIAGLTNLLLGTANRPDVSPNAITYKDAAGKWLGPGRWESLEEFSAMDGSDSWEVMGFDIGLRQAGGDPISMATGMPGGGLRVKRLAYNSGWPQRKGDPPQTQVTEYAYDCSGANGGVYSAGSTATMPPPYNNLGDDRVTQSPTVSFVEGAPFVGYRRVTEIRPGRGRVVYDFLSPADISDFITYDNCNAANIEDYFIKGYQAGCYDKDSRYGWLHTPHARWRLNKVSHFQGLMTAKTKYSERKPGGVSDIVSEEKFTYLTSLLPEDLGDISRVALLNNSDAIGITALQSFRKFKDPKDPTKGFVNQLHGGSRNYAFTEHPASENMGKAVERMRLRWYYREEQPPPVEIGFNIGLDEMEIIDHSLRQWQVESTVEGVGTRTAHSYFDFVTGEPVVSTVNALKKDATTGNMVSDPAIPTKSTVTVPANWVQEYSPTASSVTTPSMGSIYNDPKFFDWATGTLIPGRFGSAGISNKNMLSQTFSQSTYVGLTPYDACFESPATCPAFLPLLSGTNTLNRSITTWKAFAQSKGGQPAWRVDENFALRLPMANMNTVKVDRGSISAPLPPSGSNVNTLYRTNPAYVLTSQNTVYGDLGEVLESKDPYDVRTASIYVGNKLLVGQVSNSDRGSCAILAVDEMSSLTSQSTTWSATGGNLVSAFSRSGTKSLHLTSTGYKLTFSLPTVRKGRIYEFTFWTKDPGKRGFVTMWVNGTQAVIMPTTYDAAGPEWQRTNVKLDLTKTVQATVAVTGEVLLQAGTNAGMWIDDARFVAEDAHAYSMTYDFKGNLTSQSDANDVLRRYRYDAFNKLIEVQDHQGVIVSSQAEMEAK